MPKNNKYGYKKTQEQINLVTHDRILTFENFHYLLEALEEYIERAGYYPDFENKRQFRQLTIKRTDFALYQAENLFRTKLLMFVGIIGNDTPDSTKKEIKEEFYKWINVVGIDANNCLDEKLKHFLLEIENVIEEKSERIVNQTEEYIDRKRVDDPTNPEDMEKVMRIFSSIQKPMDDKREQAEFYKDKNYFEVEYENKFKKGSIEQGKEALNRLTGTVASSHDDFNFFPQTTSSSSSGTSLGIHPTNTDEVVQAVKANPKDYRLDEVAIEIDNFGRVKKKQETVYCGHARLDDFNQEGKLNFNNNPIYPWESFNAQQRFEIKQAKNISSGYWTEEEIKWVVREFKDNPSLWEIRKIDGQFYLVHDSAQIKKNEIGTLIHNKEKFSNLEWAEICGVLEINWGLIDNIEKNAKLEKDLVVFKQETSEYLEADDWYVHNQWGEKNEVGCLIFNSKAMIRAKDLNEKEQKAISYKLEATSLQNSTSVPNTPKNDNRFGISGIIATVAGISVLAIGGTVAIRKRLNKKKKG